MRYHLKSETEIKTTKKGSIIVIGQEVRITKQDIEKMNKELKQDKNITGFIYGLEKEVTKWKRKNKVIITIYSPKGEV